MENKLTKNCRMLVIALPFIFFVLILNQRVTAQTLESCNYIFRIENRRVFVDLKYNFYSPEMIDLDLDLPDDSSNIEIFLDNQLGKISFLDRDAKKIKIRRTISELEIKYVTREMLKDKLFVSEVRVPYNCSNLTMRAILSPEYVLEKPIRGEDFETATIYPKPDRIESDGQSLIFVWFLGSTTKNQNFQFVLLVKKRFEIIIVLVVSIIIFGAAIILYLKKKSPVIVKVKKIDKMTDHLKEDEEQIINILKQRGGACEQGTLRVIADMSKSNLSRILKELEERKIIEKLKKGNKNIIKLK
ncbi:MAG: helix-turn-helix transcriptional regulator [Candidatus Woesearchaeota archaeon]